MQRAVVLVCLAGFLLGTTPAHPADDSAKAASRALLRQGNARLDKGEYQPALDKFRQAYERFPSPKIFFSEGQALMGLSRNIEALTYFQRFLAEAKDATSEYQAEARKQIAELEGKLGRLEVRSNREGARVRMDGKEQGTTPLPGPILAEAGTHDLVLEWQGEHRATSVSVVAGSISSAEVSFDLRPAMVSILCNRSGAGVRLDGKVVGNTPLAAPLAIPAGEHDLVLEYQGDKQSRRLAFTEGEVKTIDLHFEDKQVVPVTPASTPPPREWYRSPWAWGAAGVVVAGVATTMILVYGQRDSYPSTNMGTQPIGD